VWITWCAQHRALTMHQGACKVSDMLLDAAAPPRKRNRREWPEHPIQVRVRRVGVTRMSEASDRYLPRQHWQTCDVESAELVATVSRESTIATINLDITSQLDQVYERVWGVRR
jgi:hypothetical protein